MNMRVLQVINSLETGGAEKLILETVPFYKKAGYDIDVLVLIGSETPFMKELKSLLCCKIFDLGMYSVYNPFLIFKIIPFLRKYDIIHVHLFPAMYWVAFARLLSFSKVKLVFTEHNTTNRRINKPLFKYLDKVVYSVYDHIVCITEEIKDILTTTYKIPLQKFTVVENGVNLDLIRNTKPANWTIVSSLLSADDRVLIQVAGFRAQKDQPTLIRAMRLLPVSVKLVLVGDGLFRENCEQLVSDLGLKERVLFLGWRMDVAALLKAADVVVLSSIYEGLSLSSIEGLGSGKPFIASDVPGLSEIVKGAGILFPVGDEQQLASEIQKLFLDSRYSQDVADACLKRAERYSINRMTDGHLELYERLVKHAIIV